MNFIWKCEGIIWITNKLLGVYKTNHTLTNQNEQPYVVIALVDHGGGVKTVFAGVGAMRFAVLFSKTSNNCTTPIDKSFLFYI